MQPLLQWKSNEYYICMCVGSLRYPACNAHVTVYTIFSTLSHKQRDFRGGINEQIVFRFSLQLLSATFLILI